MNKNGSITPEADKSEHIFGNCYKGKVLVSEGKENRAN